MLSPIRLAIVSRFIREMILISTVVGSVVVVVVVDAVVGFRVRTIGTTLGVPVDDLGRRLYGRPVVFVVGALEVVGRTVVVDR